MEQLIRDLHSPQNQGQPDVINRLQREIQSLQREPTAWQTGLDLLNSDVQLLQFYGALTISLKVNADWENDRVGEDRAQVSQLLEHLVTRYVTIAVSAQSDLVISKLASTLAAVFAKPDAAWAQPCRHVLGCMLAGCYGPQDQVPSMGNMLETTSPLPDPALKAVLRLSLAISEGAAYQTGARRQVQLANLSADVWQLLQNGLRYTPQSPAKFSSVVFQQIPFWTAFVASEQPPTHSLFDIFSDVVNRTHDLLNLPSKAGDCMSCLTSLQTHHHRLLTRACAGYRGLIVDSQAASQWIAELLQGDFSPEANSFVEFLEAVFQQLDTTTDDYLKDDDVMACIKTAQVLLRCRGAAMVEDTICQAVLDIMITIAEGYSDWPGTSKEDVAMNCLIQDARLATLTKVQYPAEELDKSTAMWDEDDNTRFEDFRFQAKDYFQTAFGIFGPSLIDELSVSVTTASKTDWTEFEAVVWVLGSVSDALSNEPERCDPSLDQIFTSNLWLRATSDSEGIPSRVRRSIITLLSETTSYLQRKPQYLIGSLDFLFRSLQIRAHSNHAAKAIFNLCDSQRSFLVQALPQFLQTLTTLEGIPLLSRSKVLCAVSALVQALPSEEDKVQPLQKMLQLIQNLETRNADVDPTPEDETYNPLFGRLSMLGAMAKGSISPAETPIDLEARNNDPTATTFWTDGPGQETQQLIVQMLAEPWNHLLEPEQSDLVTLACEFLRAGFKESHPTPFRFSSQTSTTLLIALIDPANPNLDQTMNTASCYVSSSPKPTPETSCLTDNLISGVITITRDSVARPSDPTTNADFSAPTSILDFTIRALPKLGTYILTHPEALQMMNLFINYALLLLQSQIDTLPRRAATAFFTSFIEYTDPSSTLMSSPAVCTTLTTLMDAYSPEILATTLNLIAGSAARSELDSLSLLLRAYVRVQPMRSKTILAQAIHSPVVLSQRALQATKHEQRTRFLAVVEGLRGARRTNEAVREFWVSCRGGGFGYVV